MEGRGLAAEKASAAVFFSTDSTMCRERNKDSGLTRGTNQRTNRSGGGDRGVVVRVIPRRLHPAQTPDGKVRWPTSR